MVITMRLMIPGGSWGEGRKGWMDGWMERISDPALNHPKKKGKGRKDGRKGWMDGWKQGRKGGWKDGRTQKNGRKKGRNIRSGLKLS